MADGSLTGLSLLYSGAVSEARPPSGPRIHPPEWKGMGPRCCHCRTSYPPQRFATISHPLPLRLLLLLAFYSFAWASGRYLIPLHLSLIHI